MALPRWPAPNSSASASSRSARRRAKRLVSSGGRRAWSGEGAVARPANTAATASAETSTVCLFARDRRGRRASGCSSPPAVDVIGHSDRGNPDCGPASGGAMAARPDESQSCVCGLARSAAKHMRCRAVIPRTPPGLPRRDPRRAANGVAWSARDALPPGHGRCGRRPRRGGDDRSPRTGMDSARPAVARSARPGLAQRGRRAATGGITCVRRCS